MINFNFNPVSTTIVSSGTYTVPAGKHCLVTTLPSSSRLIGLSVNGVTTHNSIPTNSQTYMLPSGSTISVTAGKLIVQLYDNIT